MPTAALPGAACGQPEECASGASLIKIIGQRGHNGTQKWVSNDGSR